jgi:argininosuccinate synthase
MDREVTRLRDSLGVKFAESVYYGFWFAPEFEILRSMIDSNAGDGDRRCPIKAV